MYRLIIICPVRSGLSGLTETRVTMAPPVTMVTSWLFIIRLDSYYTTIIALRNRINTTHIFSFNFGQLTHLAELFVSGNARLKKLAKASFSDYLTTYAYPSESKSPGGRSATNTSRPSLRRYLSVGGLDIRCDCPLSWLRSVSVTTRISSLQYDVVVANGAPNSFRCRDDVVAMATDPLTGVSAVSSRSLLAGLRIDACFLSADRSERCRKGLERLRFECDNGLIRARQTRMT